ncbi:uncharacterized protein LOC100372957 [Saccoglossus kowalevskii]|uniref:Uncharacterized protein LOC100372957 n=1 Tax=Saccoglossus kowalevskii TaxID=10224 RepID=A0ABM0LXK2_SACKO|nr:PREDICTED: uncharacterized protein LOC100372957 [Saccoglossus kowalevskii]
MSSKYNRGTMQSSSSSWQSTTKRSGGGTGTGGGSIPSLLSLGLGRGGGGLLGNAPTDLMSSNRGGNLPSGQRTDLISGMPSSQIGGNLPSGQRTDLMSGLSRGNLLSGQRTDLMSCLPRGNLPSGQRTDLMSGRPSGQIGGNLPSLMATTNNRQSLLGPGPGMAPSNFGSGMGMNQSFGNNLGGGSDFGNRNLSSYGNNDFRSNTGFGGSDLGGGLGSGGMGQQGVMPLDDSLVAKVRLQQAMLAQMTQQPGRIGNAGGYGSRTRDTSPRGDLMSRRIPYSGRQRDIGNRSTYDMSRNQDRGRRNQNQRDSRDKPYLLSRQQHRSQYSKPNERRHDDRTRFTDIKRSQTSRKDSNQSTHKQSGKGSTKSETRSDDGHTTPTTPCSADEDGNFDEENSDIYDTDDPTDDEEKDASGDAGVVARKRKLKSSGNEGEKDESSKNLDDITVTIKKDKDGRAVTEPPRKKAATSGTEGKDSQDETSETKSTAMPQPNWFCHVCQIRCMDLKTYENHMRGQRHKRKMENIKQLSEFQTQQATARLHAEQHIKNILGDDKKHFCEECKDSFKGSVIEHRKTFEHKVSKKEGRPYCRVCNVSFKNPKKFVAHCNTAGHKKVYELARKKAEQEAKKRGREFKEDEEGYLPPNMEDFVTVDAVGIFEDDDGDTDEDDDNIDDDDDDDGETLAKLPSNTSAMQKMEVDNAAESQTVFDENSDKPTAGVSASARQTNKKPRVSATIPKLMAVKTKPPKSTPAAAAPMPLLGLSSEIGLDLELGPYNPDMPVGQEHVVPVAGFFCKLCHKFYNNESNAKFSHCKTKPHYTAVKKYLNKQKEELIKSFDFENSSDGETKPHVEEKPRIVTKRTDTVKSPQKHQNKQSPSDVDTKLQIDEKPKLMIKKTETVKSPKATNRVEVAIDGKDDVAKETKKTVEASKALLVKNKEDTSKNEISKSGESSEVKEEVKGEVKKIEDGFMDVKTKFEVSPTPAIENEKPVNIQQVKDEKPDLKKDKEVKLECKSEEGNNGDEMTDKVEDETSESMDKMKDECSIVSVDDVLLNESDEALTISSHEETETGSAIKKKKTLNEKATGDVADVEEETDTSNEGGEADVVTSLATHKTSPKRGRTGKGRARGRKR